MKEGLIVFDTNVVEGRYLPRLLLEEPIADFDALRSHENTYAPAIVIKSIYEIWHHAKLGRPKLAWMDDSFGYPGGIDEGRRILRKHPDCASEENLHFWFGLCEEWMCLDWDAEKAQLESMVRPEARQSVAVDIAVRRAFTSWKARLCAFCDRIWNAIENQMDILSSMTSMTERVVGEHFQLLHQLCRESILPNEDLEILATTLQHGAAGFVTEDSRILKQTGLSLTFNHGTAFVHPDRLREAAQEDFSIRWSNTQCARRDSTTRNHG
jgi:hypothetical protein